MYPFATQKDAEQFAEMVAEAMLRKQQHPTPKHVTFTEAMQTLGIGTHALKRRLDAKRIVTWRHGKGKAFDRIHLYQI
jgi:hypothetical protein